MFSHYHVPRLGQCGYVTHAVHHARLLRDKMEVPPGFYGVHAKIMELRIHEHFSPEEVAIARDRFQAQALAQRAILN